MYVRLDTEISGAVAARERKLTEVVEEPGTLFVRDSELSHQTDGVHRRRAAEHALCFGRIDGDDLGGSLHIGRIGLRTASGEVLLVDWRAAAARPFYSATAAQPHGLRRRRHLRTEGRQVVGVSDEILDGSSPTDADVVADGPLTAALSAARTGRMREAAATLQQEQDDIVRSTHRGITVVDGGPGTGKTIVALHRAAFMLYAFSSIADRGVLVVGPNRHFLDYISDVLPSLGENGVQLATLSDLAATETTRSEPDEVARSKGRAKFADKLASRVRNRQPPADESLRIDTSYGSVDLNAVCVEAGRRSALRGGVGHNRARQRFTEYVVDNVVTDLERQATAETVDFENDLKNLFGIDLNRMFAGEPEQSDSQSAVESGPDWDRVREELLHDPSIKKTIDDIWPPLDPEVIVRELLTDSSAMADMSPALSTPGPLSITDPAERGWSLADLALIDEARELIDGLPDTTFGHLVVDEAQLLSEMQWRMLMRRCPNRSMTIVGDLAQAGPTTSIRSWSEALGPFVEDRFHHHTLTVNYRTTEEILTFSGPTLAQIAPEQQLSRSIRHGQQPVIVTTTDERVDAELNRLLRQLANTTPEELTAVVASETRAPSISLGGFGTVIAATETRGLEFDSVIIIDPDEIQAAGEAGLRDLYVAQTRATKRLIILQVNRPPVAR